MRGYLSRLKKAVKGETKKSKKEDKDEDSFGEHSQEGRSQEDLHQKDHNSSYLDDDDECAGVSRISLDLELDLDMKVFGEHIAGDFPPSPQLQHHRKNNNRNYSTPNSNHGPSYQAPRPLSLGMEIGGDLSKRTTLGRSLSDPYDEDLDDLLDEELDKLSDNEDIDSVGSAQEQIFGDAKTDILTKASDHVHASSYIENADDNVHKKSFDGCDTELADIQMNQDNLKDFKVEDSGCSVGDSESSHSLNNSSHRNRNIELNGIEITDGVSHQGEEYSGVKLESDQQDDQISSKDSSYSNTEDDAEVVNGPSNLEGDSESTAIDKSGYSEPNIGTEINLFDSCKENKVIISSDEEHGKNNCLQQEIEQNTLDHVDEDMKKDECSKEAEKNKSVPANDYTNEEFVNNEGDRDTKRDSNTDDIVCMKNNAQAVSGALLNEVDEVSAIKQEENLTEQGISSNLMEGDIVEKEESTGDEKTGSEDTRQALSESSPVLEHNIAERKTCEEQVKGAVVEEKSLESSSDVPQNEEESTSEKESEQQLMQGITPDTDSPQFLDHARPKAESDPHKVIVEAETANVGLDDAEKDLVGVTLKLQDSKRLEGDDNKIARELGHEVPVGKEDSNDNEEPETHEIVRVEKELSGEEGEVEMTTNSVTVGGSENNEAVENVSKEINVDEVDRADDSIRMVEFGNDDVIENRSKKNRSNRGSLCQTESESDDEFDSAQEEFSEDEVKEAINENYGDPDTLHLPLNQIVLGPPIGESSTDNTTDAVTCDSETSTPNYIDAAEDFSTLIGSVEEVQKDLRDTSENQAWKNELRKESLEVVKDSGYYSLPMSPKLSETSRNNQQVQIRNQGSNKTHDDDDGDSLTSSEGAHTSSRANSVSVELNSSTDSTYSSQQSDGAEEQVNHSKPAKVSDANADSLRKSLEKRRLSRTVSRSKSNDINVLDSSCASDKSTASGITSLSQESPSSDQQSKSLYASPGEGMLVHIVHGAHSEAEARLAQRRAARAEARELRLRELEKQQKDQDTEEEKQYVNTYSAEPPTPPRSNLSSRASVSRTTNSIGQYSRRSSEDSTNDDSLPASARELRAELKELDEKFRKAMITNAQLDNEKATLTYEVELYKDRFMDLEEQHTQLTKEHKKKCSEFEQLKRVSAKLQEENQLVRRLLEEKDELIQEYGLVIVGEEGEGSEEDDDTVDLSPRKLNDAKKALLSQEAAELLAKGAAQGSLDLRLRKLAEDKNELEDQVRRLKMELEEEHCKSRRRKENGLDFEKQKEANKTVNEYKFRVQKAEAEVSTLQANVARLEALVTRYKAQAEELEKSEEELKVEKRKLQRELRDNQSRLEEIETTNSHLQKRFDKLKTARSTLLKDLSQDPA